MRTKVALVVAMAMAVLAFANATASAGHLSLSSQHFRITWRLLQFYNENRIEKDWKISCPVTIEGSFHRATFAKTRYTLIGAVTRAIVKEESCINGRASFLEDGLPWGIDYLRFLGTLPNIASIGVEMQGMAFDMTNGSTTCLYMGEEASLVGRQDGEFTRAGGGQILTFAFEPGEQISLFAGGFFCEFLSYYAGFEGTGEVFVLGSSSRIILYLI